MNINITIIDNGFILSVMDPEKGLVMQTFFGDASDVADAVELMLLGDEHYNARNMTEELSQADWNEVVPDYNN